MVFDLSQLKQKQGEHKILVLACMTCKTLEEIPSDDRFPINQQGNNPFLQLAVEKHQRPEPHLGQLMDVDFVVWKSKSGRAEIQKQLFQGSEGLGQDVYDAKDNYSTDAMACFEKHLRPKGQCPDYKSGAKLIKIDVMKSERKDAGLSTDKLPSFYLCDFCPVKTYNMERYNKEKGLYN